jgi:hypothetical protein
MQLFAKLLKILPVQSGTGPNGPWKKRDIIVESLDQYHNKICVSIWIEKIDLNTFSPGDLIKIPYYLSSKESNGRWFTQVIAIWIEKYDPEEISNNNATALSVIDSELVLNACMLSFDPETRKQFGFPDNNDLPDLESVILILTQVFKISPYLDTNKLRSKVLDILKFLFPGVYDNISLSISDNITDDGSYLVSELIEFDESEKETDLSKIKSSEIMAKKQMQDFFGENSSRMKSEPEKFKKLIDDLKSKMKTLTNTDEDVVTEI